MAIFSRRVLQRIINENSKILSKEQTLKLVEALNRTDENSLGFEWEIVLINVLSKFGKVEYEPNLGGASRPDIKFDSTCKDKLSFVADIATVSDRSNEEDSPCQDFHDEFMRLAKKYKLRLNSFSIKIWRKEEGDFRDRKIKLKIPQKGKFEEFFNDFKSYLREIANNPDASRDFSIKTNSIEVAVKYNPIQQYANMGYASYTTPYSLTKNALYNALKNKAEQLKKTNYSGSKAIFLCDGGCESLTNNGYAGRSYSTKEIIDNFLRQHSSVSFVLLFTARSNPHSLAIRPILGTIKLFKNTTAKQKIDFESTFLAQELHKVFPTPVNDVINAIIQLDSYKRSKFSPFYGGLYMTANTIKISARALLELLAGKIDQKNFFEDYKFFESFPGGNYFADRLREGRLISKIGLEKTEEDDDWITIEFGKPDPAISKFVAP